LRSPHWVANLFHQLATLVLSSTSGQLIENLSYFISECSLLILGDVVKA
jgi:hypothetical protein